jgi:hypothetical protein
MGEPAPEEEVFDRRADDRPAPDQAVNTAVSDFTKMDEEIGKAIPQDGKE